MRRRPPTEWIRAASRRVASDPENASGSASRACASTRAAASETSPDSIPRRVSGIASSARATLVAARAVPHDARCTEASHDAADRCPSLSPVDLRQAPQALQLEQLGRLVQLREVLLDPGIRELGERLGPEPLDRRHELAHPALPSNMCSRLDHRRTQNSDDGHTGGTFLNE